MPARRPPGPRIRTAPMRCADSDFAAAARLAVGSMETMSPPKLRFLAARIDLTFMAASLARMIIFWTLMRENTRPGQRASMPGYIQRSCREGSSVKPKWVKRTPPYLSELGAFQQRRPSAANRFGGQTRKKKTPPREPRRYGPARQPIDCCRLSAMTPPRTGY